MSNEPHLGVLADDAGAGRRSPGSARKALIVANDEYVHGELKNLQAPGADAEALRRVLGDPHIGGFGVQIMRNEPAQATREKLEELFSRSQRDDLLVLHFSGHGLKNDSGELFLAASDTRLDMLNSTAVSAEFVQRCMREAKARNIVLLLDCCYSGAFAEGVAVRTAGDVDVIERVWPPQSGRGRAVITASTALEYAFEGGRLADDKHGRPSVFTGVLVEGLATGDADQNEDGLITLDELYDYVSEEVKKRNPHQTPSCQLTLEGTPYVARSRRRRIHPAPVPPDVRAALDDPSPYARRGTIHELESLIDSPDESAAAGAYEALAKLARRDVQSVAVPATAAMGRVAIRPEQTRLDFGKQRQGSEPAHRRIRLLGPRLARACTPRASHEWIGVNETDEGLDVWIDTTAAGTRRGSISLKGTTGTAEVTVVGQVMPRAALLAGIGRSFADRRVLAGASVVLVGAAVALAAILPGRLGRGPAPGPSPTAGPTRPSPTGTATTAATPAAAMAPAIVCSGSITLVGGAFGSVAQLAADAYALQCDNKVKITIDSTSNADSAYGASKVSKLVTGHSAQAGSWIAMYDGTTSSAKGLTGYPVGIFIYSVVAHTGAIPGRTITVPELKQLYTQPDGLPGKVGVSLQKGSGTRQALLGLWNGAGKQRAPVPVNVCPAPSLKRVAVPTCHLDSYQTMLAFVDGTPNGIGYLALGTEVKGHPAIVDAEGRTHGYPSTSVISIKGAAPTPENVRKGVYPFVAVEHLYLSPRPAPLAKSFVEYLRWYVGSRQLPDVTPCSNAPTGPLTNQCVAPS